jgi:hypothetical protein
MIPPILAAGTVSTNINWGQVIIMLSGVIVAIIAVGGFIDKRLKDRQTEMKSDIASAVNNLSTILTERLETKENVAALRIEVAKMSERMSMMAHPPVTSVPPPTSS